jgi:hypothetical protein
MNIMKTFKMPGKGKREAELARVENYLRATLQPVELRPAFAASLKTRLAKGSFTVTPAPILFQYVLLALAGIASGALLFLAGARAAVTVLGLLGILHTARGQMEAKRSSLV